MWFFEEEPWQYRVLDALPSGIDHAQLERARAWTPSQRLDALVELVAVAEDLKSAMAAKKKGET